MEWILVTKFLLVSVILSHGIKSRKDERINLCKDRKNLAKKWARYYIDINKDDIKKHQEFLTNTFKSAYNYSNR